MRQAYLPEDRDQTRIVVLFMALLVLIFLPSEYAQFAGQPMFTKLVAIRTTLLVGIGIVSYALTRVRTPRQLDTIVTGLIACGVPMVILLNYIYASHFATDLVILIAIYLALPARLGVQIAGALTLSLADVYIDQLVMTRADPNDVIATHLFANLFGVAMRRHQLRIRRELFETNRQEAEVRGDLEEALRNVRQLSGLLPICAVCKKIRGERDDWQSIESYIDAHSEARFTHSYCPECAAEFERDEI